MKKISIPETKEVPTLEILKKTLIDKFNNYNVVFFGFGAGRRIKLKKNVFVAASVFIRSKKRMIFIKEDFGSVFVAFLFFIITGFIGYLFIRPKITTVMDEVDKFLSEIYSV
jgi:hypothetical protein